MLGVSLLDRRTNEWVRRRTGLVDVVRYCRERKWRWVARLARMEHLRWPRALVEWHPRGPTRRKGRPAMRWRDDLVNAVGTEFLRKAADREEWKAVMALHIQ